MEKDKIAMEVLKTDVCNKGFIAAFEDAVARKKTPVAAVVTVKVPPAATGREAAVRILPLKDKTETVRVALVFLDPPERAVPGDRHRISQ